MGLNGHKPKSSNSVRESVKAAIPFWERNMKRTFIAIFILLLLPIVAQAYVLVLKDGRRVEVRNQYRIVSNIAVFTLPEGNRFSISVDKINIAATELANGDEPGAFVKNVTEPPAIDDKKADSDQDENPIVASNKPTSRKITNSDFERYRVRREEMARDAARRASEKAAANPTPTLDQTSVPAPAATAAPQAQPALSPEEEVLAKRRENEKNKEQYWRGRSKAILTQLRVLEEQIVVIQAQLEESKRNTPQSPTGVSVYNPPIYQPGITIGGIPIGIGGGRSTGGSSTVIINQNPGQQRSMTLQERLTDLQLKYQETLIQYDELLEEARKDGALPGWLR